ncbi:MAG: zinc-dependent alcohol dehydrogenase [Phototrophicaceae bacterium]|jgi:L-iditol 2-dehydrogenase
MKRVKIAAPHELTVIEDDTPQPQAGEVLLAIRTIGICGSDLHVYEGQHPFVTYPVLPGHEVCGDIIAVGAGVDPTLIGKKAVIEPSLPAGKLPHFGEGRYNISSDLRVMGFQAPGAMAEQFAVPLNRIHLLPEGFSDDLGASVEPTAVAVHAVRLVSGIAGLRIGVIGAGAIGLLTAQVAKTYGAAQVTIADLDPARLDVAMTLGLTATPQLQAGEYDVVFECVGVQASIRSALLACTKGARVVVMGVFGKDASIPMGIIQDWELQLMGSLMYTGDDYREAIRLLGESLVRVDCIITHRYPLAQAEAAFHKALERGQAIKVLLETI